MAKKGSLPDTFTVARWYNTRYAAGHEQSFGRPPEESARRLDKLNLGTHLKVLDVACGQGYFLQAADERGHQTYGVDIADEAVRISRQISPQSKTLVASGQALPFPRHYFDVVTCWGSLEHHPNMEQALSEFMRVIKPGGTIFLRVPNRAFWLYRLTSRLGRPIGTEQSDVIEHLLTLTEWEGLFEKAGLKIVQVTSDNWFVQQPFRSAHGMNAKILLLLRKTALAVAPLPSTYTFDFLCEAPI